MWRDLNPMLAPKMCSKICGIPPFAEYYRFAQFACATIYMLVEILPYLALRWWHFVETITFRKIEGNESNSGNYLKR